MEELLERAAPPRRYSPARRRCGHNAKHHELAGRPGRNRSFLQECGLERGSATEGCSPAWTPITPSSSWSHCLALIPIHPAVTENPRRQDTPDRAVARAQLFPVPLLATAGKRTLAYLKLPGFSTPLLFAHTSSTPTTPAHSRLSTPATLKTPTVRDSITP